MSVPSSELGPPTSYSARSVTPPQVPTPKWGRDTLACWGGGLGGPDCSEEGTDTLVLFVYYNRSTLKMIDWVFGHLKKCFYLENHELALSIFLMDTLHSSKINKNSKCLYK